MPVPYQTSLEEEFRTSPPHTTAEACRHYDNFNFAEFCGAIDSGLDKTPPPIRHPHDPQLPTLQPEIILHRTKYDSGTLHAANLTLNYGY